MHVRFPFLRSIMCLYLRQKLSNITRPRIVFFFFFFFFLCRCACEYLNTCVKCNEDIISRFICFWLFRNLFNASMTLTAKRILIARHCSYNIVSVWVNASECVYWNWYRYSKAKEKNSSVFMVDQNGRVIFYFLSSTSSSPS